MDKTRMKSWYDPKVDILYLVLKPGMVSDSEEIDIGIILEYNDEKEVAGIEIHQARSRIVNVIGESLSSMLDKRLRELQTT